MDRNELKRIRSQIQNRKEKEKAIVEKLLPFLKSFKKIGSYRPIGSEVNPEIPEISTAALSYPKSHEDGSMEFFPGNSFEKGLYGIEEPLFQDRIPVIPECLIVPLLGFDKTYRIGYGKGYYDRYLADHPEIFTIGLAFDEQETQFDPNPWDIPLDLIITPSRILKKGEKYES